MTLHRILSRPVPFQAGRRARWGYQCIIAAISIVGAASCEGKLSTLAAAQTKARSQLFAGFELRVLAIEIPGMDISAPGAVLGLYWLGRCGGHEDHGCSVVTWAVPVFGSWQRIVRRRVAAALLD